MKYTQPYGVSDPNASYVNGDPAIGLQGSIVPAGAIEPHQREIVALITASGLTPDGANLQQLLTGVRSQSMNCQVSTNNGAGEENALVVTCSPPIANLTAGLPLRVLIPQANSGDTWMTVDGIHAQVVRANGSVLAADDLVAGMIADFLFDGSKWQMSNFFGLPATNTTTNTYVVNIPYCVDSSVVVNSVVANFSPAVTGLNPGDMLKVKLANTVTGATLITVNALPQKQMVRYDSSALRSNDIVAGQILILEYDGTNFQVVNAQGSSNAFVTGAIYMWPGETAPLGCYECNGQALSRTGAGARLFGIVGVMYGAGDGSTTFNLPDYRGMFLRGWDHGKGVDPDAAGRTARPDAIAGDHIGTTQSPAAGAISLSGTLDVSGATVAMTTGKLRLKNPMWTASTSDPADTDQFAWNQITMGSGITGPQINWWQTSDTSNLWGGFKGDITELNGTMTLHGPMSVNGTSGSTETRPRNTNVMFIIAA